MTRFLGLLLAIALASLAVRAGAEPADAPGPRSSAAVTDRGRSLDHILDRLLAGSPGEEPRSLVLLIDPSPSLVTARFADALEGALGRLAAPDLEIGVGVVGGDPVLRLVPGTNRPAVLTAIRTALTGPRDQIRDVMTAIRQTALRLKSRPGRREIALISLENGDGEADLESTAGGLARTGIVLHAVGRAAFLADCYWVRRSTTAPRDLDMRGQDAAYDDLPWGWLLRRAPANESVSSGFGMYGLSRLVETTGGRYYLFYPPASFASSCCPYSGCRLCPADHAECGTRYQTHKLRALAPPLVSRVATRKTLARDPVFVGVLKIWGKASAAGLLSSRPPLRAGPGLLREDRRRTRTLTAWTGTTNFSGVSRKAGKLADECGRLAREMQEAIDYADPARTSARSLAIAETTRAQLLVTRLNLRLLQAFCAAAPGWLARPMEGRLPPESPLFDTREFDYRGIGFTSQCFCHGTERVMRLEIPGLVEAETERTEAFAAVERLIARYDGTPFGRVARTMGVAIFYLTVPARTTTTTRRIPGTEDDGTTTGGAARPARSGGGDGSGGGATTGGE